MRKKILIRAAAGFLLGIAVSVVISLLFNRTADGAVHFYSSALLNRVGNATAAALLQLAVCGLYGAACMCGTLLYEIERWPLALATAVHYLIISLLYAQVASLLEWELTLHTLLFIEGLMTAGFLAIWLIMYFLYKAEVRKLNELMKKRNEEMEKNG